MEKYLEETNLVQVICEKAGLLLEDVYNDANKNKLELEDIQDILYEEAELMEDTMHIPISRMDVYTISMELEESKVMDLLEARTLRKQEPAVYFGLQYGLSYVTIGVFLVLTLVMMVLLAKSNRWNVMHTVKDLGVTLTVLGVVLLLLVVAPVVLPVILSGVEGAQLIGIAAKVVFAGFRMPCLITLLTGIVLLVINKVAKKLADRKAAA